MDDVDKLPSLCVNAFPRRSTDAMDRKHILCQVDSNRRHYAHGTSPLEKIDLANQSWHTGATSGRGSPLHSLTLLSLLRASCASEVDHAVVVSFSCSGWCRSAVFAVCALAS